MLSIKEVPNTDPSAASQQTGCPAVPENLTTLNPLNVTGGFGQFRCLKCFPFNKLESESLHLPSIGLVMSLDDKIIAMSHTHRGSSDGAGDLAHSCPGFWLQAVQMLPHPMPFILGELLWTFV